MSTTTCGELSCDECNARTAALMAERDQLRAEVQRLNALGSWAHTCIHHTDQQRAACPVCLVAALTAERDQLRARAERAEADLATERAKVQMLREDLAFYDAS